MSTVNADVKLTDSLERQLTEQALNRQAEEGLNFSALLQTIRFVLSGVLDGVFAARKEAAKGEW